ncbi:hypothetical protein SMD22_14040 [Brevibacillus halotolerans]|nr:hypothetical protein SMD22_14040 [Brevibacillus halotolerans]
MNLMLMKGTISFAVVGWCLLLLSLVDIDQRGMAGIHTSSKIKKEVFHLKKPLPYQSD